MVIRTPRDPSKVNVQFHMSPELLSGEPRGQTGAGAPREGHGGLRVRVGSAQVGAAQEETDSVQKSRAVCSACWL